MEKRFSFWTTKWLTFYFTVSFSLVFIFDSIGQNPPAIQWDKTFGGNDVDDLTCLMQTADGGFILGGISRSGISGDKTQSVYGSNGYNDFWVIKTDANGNKIWDKTFGCDFTDDLISLQQTSDGGYILGGNSASGISGNKTQTSIGSTDYWIVKLDANGNKLWDKAFGSSLGTVFGSLQQTTDGGYILGGTSNSPISGDKTQPSRGENDFWIIKTDASGNKLWDKTFGGLDDDYLTSLQQTSDGGYILGGQSLSDIGGDKTQASQGSMDYWIVKTDPIGNKQWDKTFGGPHLDEMVVLQQTSDGGYILGGQSLSDIGGDKTQVSQGSMDYWIVKTDPIGNKQWDKTFGGDKLDFFSTIKQTSDGGYILGGQSSSGLNGDKSQASQGYADYWIIRINNNGIKLWDKSIGGILNDGMSDLKQTTDGGYILGGNSESYISGDKTSLNKGTLDFWIVKLAPDILGTKEDQTNINLSLFPNPNQGKFTIQLSNLTSPKAEVTVSNLLGRVVLHQQLTVSNKQISEELNLPHAKGMYLLQVKAGEQVITRKIVVE